MKKLILLIPAFWLMSFITIEPGITKAERKSAIESLNKSKDDLLASVKGLSADQLNFKSSPEAWSVAACVEHIAISETSLFALIENTLKEPANAAKRSEVKWKDEQLFAAITDRSHKVKTFEALEPTGKFGTYDATLQEFLNKRKSNIDYLKKTKEDLRNHFFTFPVEALGTVDAYQLFYFISGHTKRHTLQIEEIRNNPAFPKK